VMKARSIVLERKTESWGDTPTAVQRPRGGRDEASATDVASDFDTQTQDRNMNNLHH